MLYAKVVLGLPVEGPFDYIVPGHLTKKIKAGQRVWVNFATRKMVGYVVKLTPKTNIKNLKTISELIDESAVLDKNMLLLTKELSDYYCCSWGEAIETALPEGLRKGKRIPYIKDNEPRPCTQERSEYVKSRDTKEVILIHDLERYARWDIYLKAIKETQGKNRAVIFLAPDIQSVLRARERIAGNLGITPTLLYRKQPKEIDVWLKIKRGEINIVVGTRAAVFAPFNNLGLIIIDEEEDFVYKQDQVPHYNAREVGFMRINIEKAKLILGSKVPSLESFYLARKGKINPSTTLRVNGESFDVAQDVSKDAEPVEAQSRTIKYTLLPRVKNFPEIKIIDTVHQRRDIKTKAILSRYTIDSIIAALNRQEKILMFLNRRGFATFASCNNCGRPLKCPRCNINLVYHFKDNILNCHYCNFKMQPPTICPECNSGYIKYSGIGTEKLESELSRIFPQAKIKRWDEAKRIDLKDIDILISTQHIIKETDLNFDLIAVVAIDNSLNRIDFRASEKTFGLLIGLLGLTDKKLIIQTHLAKHHCFKALEQKDINMFYRKELSQRKQVRFPPYQHLGLVKLRGKNEVRVKEVSDTLFKKLYRYKDRGIEVISVNPAQPAKLRGNFYWQILVRSSSAKKISRFLKIYLKDLSHSGIIVTVDVDPL